ncbi:hypothetical protein KAW65_00715 [candidate division WOR-3 bacterium]|nr:hypothetical protein [candidate division WOR-3 bacterium]
MRRRKSIKVKDLTRCKFWGMVVLEVSDRDPAKSPIESGQAGFRPDISGFPLRSNRLNKPYILAY